MSVGPTLASRPTPRRLRSSPERRSTPQLLSGVSTVSPEHSPWLQVSIETPWDTYSVPRALLLPQRNPSIQHLQSLCPQLFHPPRSTRAWTPLTALSLIRHTSTSVPVFLHLLHRPHPTADRKSTRLNSS